MKLFLWKNVDDLIEHYHSDAGVVVVADNAERAARLILEHAFKNQTLHQSERHAKTFKLEGPDETFELVGDHKENLFVFPNAGCC
jgi:hypothetical protein